MSTDRPRIERHAARVLLVSEDSSTLLVRGQDPADLGRGQFYWTPGGGLEAGEEPSVCARREVLEEVGYAIDPAHPGLRQTIATRSSTFPFDGNTVTQHEVFFFVDIAERFRAAPEDLSELEHRAIVAFEWLTPEQMRASEAAVYPIELPDLIDQVRSGGRPVDPIVFP